MYPGIHRRMGSDRNPLLGVSHPSFEGLLDSAWPLEVLRAEIIPPVWGTSNAVNEYVPPVFYQSHSIPSTVPDIA